MKKIAAVALSAVMALSLVACGGSKGLETGKYVLKEITSGDFSVKEGDSMYDTIKDAISFEIVDDSTFKITTDSDSAEGTYTIDGSDITLKASNDSEEEMNGTVDGSKITIVEETDDGETTMVFELED